MAQTAVQTASELEDLSGIVVEQADRLFRAYATKERMAEADNGQWPAELWRAVVDAGLLLAMVPEAQGGVGLSAVDALKLIRRAGFHTLPVPLAETMVAASLWAEASGQAIDAVLSLAPTTPGDGMELARSREGYTLTGTARRVPWGGAVEQILLHARDGSGNAYLVMAPRGSAAVEARLNLANEARDTIRFDHARLPEDAVRPAPAACADGLLAFGALARAQQMIGAMERCLDYALGYAMERKQFGRPIGKFQAVQQMLAVAAGEYAAAAAAGDLAREAYGTTGFEFAVAVAKARAGEAAGKVAEVCHQVHGGMGFTQEHPLHFATRRLWSWRDEFGHETYWQARIGQMVCAGGGEALWPMLTKQT